MGIQSFLKATKGDPDWAFTPEQYFDKEFKIIDHGDNIEALCADDSMTESKDASCAESGLA